MVTGSMVPISSIIRSLVILSFF